MGRWRPVVRSTLDEHTCEGVNGKWCKVLLVVDCTAKIEKEEESICCFFFVCVFFSCEPEVRFSYSM